MMMQSDSKLGRYELLTRIAIGGMGEIFLARLEGAGGFQKLCVIKRILPHLADDPRYRSMLITEARIAANISHANICHVYELAETDNQLYLVMEYLEGVTLLQVVRWARRERQQLDYGLIAGIVQQTCDGLHHAHELRDRSGEPLGVVHRDVTPSNLFLTEAGVVKIVDFGIARVKDTASTEVGVIKGKYAYMAPELVERSSGSIDRRVDVFSLAVVIFEMVTRTQLYQRESDYLTCRALMEPPALDLSRHRPDVPAAVTDVLARGLTRDLGERYATVRQLGAAIVDALGARPWGQAEISELVRGRFGDDIQRNKSEVSNIIRQLEQAARNSDVISKLLRGPDDSAYVSIETDVQYDPALPPGPHSERRSGPFGEAQRPGSPLSPVTLPTAAPPSLLQRAVSTAAILGGAVVVLIVGLALIGPAARGSAATQVPMAATVEPHAAPNEPYGAAVHAHERELDQCARNHAEALPSATTAMVLVDHGGRARRISILPDAVEAGALGACIRAVLQTVAFPTASQDKELALGLGLRR